jgi:hypothetical protein
MHLFVPTRTVADVDKQRTVVKVARVWVRHPANDRVHTL